MTDGSRPIGVGLVRYVRHGRQHLGSVTIDLDFAPLPPQDPISVNQKGAAFDAQRFLAVMLFQLDDFK